LLRVVYFALGRLIYPTCADAELHTSETVSNSGTIIPL